PRLRSIAPPDPAGGSCPLDPASAELYPDWGNGTLRGRLRCRPPTGHASAPRCSFMGDLVIGFHILVPAVYFTFALNVLLGRLLRSRRTVVNTAAVTLAGSLQFFVN